MKAELATLTQLLNTLVAQQAASSGQGTSGGGGNPTPAPTTSAIANPVPRSALSDIKLGELPKLGKDKGELPYHKWHIDAMAVIAAARAKRVLDDPPPDPSVDADYFAWFEHADSAVFAALLSAVRSIPVLSDHVRRHAGSIGCARNAWLAIRDHYVRLADSNLSFLTGKLKALRPNEKESMESFLNRCELLRSEYAQFGLDLDDAQLLTQVFSVLSRMWKHSIGHARTPISGLTWGEVKFLLQEEDNGRRQADASAPDSLLPLGWSRRPPNSRPQDNSTRPSASAAGGKPYSSPDGKPRVTVCWFCFKFGHMWPDCRNKPEGWQPSEEARKKALDMKNAREKELRSRASRGQSRASTSSPEGTSAPPTQGASSSSSTQAGEPSTHGTI
jgi:hypothetical protein